MLGACENVALHPCEKDTTLEGELRPYYKRESKPAVRLIRDSLIYNEFYGSGRRRLLRLLLKNSSVTALRRKTRLDRTPEFRVQSD